MTVSNLLDLIFYKELQEENVMCLIKNLKVLRQKSLSSDTLYIKEEIVIFQEHIFTSLEMVNCQ